MDAVRYYSNKHYFLQADINREQIKKLQKNNGVAFITFRSASLVEHIINRFRYIKKNIEETNLTMFR